MNNKTKKRAVRKPNYRKPKTVEELTRRNVETILALEEAAKSARSTYDRFASTTARFCGRIQFVWFHVIWFGIWIAINTCSSVGTSYAAGKTG